MRVDCYLVAEPLPVIDIMNIIHTWVG